MELTEEQVLLIFEGILAALVTGEDAGYIDQAALDEWTKRGLALFGEEFLLKIAGRYVT